MSILDKFVDFLGPKTPIEMVVEFDQSSNPVIEDSSQLFSADFGRDGADLVLSNFGQPDIRLPGYFSTDNPADIHTADGKVLSGDVVEKLAGPEFPAQYAQAGSTGGAGAIGQVESISGDVTVLRASGVRETLSLGAKVFANDVVQTGPGGALSLTFVDGTIFTLAESSRMVLDSLIYDPASTANSGIFNLVEGSFVFIAGEVAKTGGMEVKTPAATMGIRGTTVLVKITSTNGVTEVEVSLNQDPDGSQGQFTITGLDGSVIANVDSTDTKWIISPVEGQTREVERTAEELSDDQNFLSQAFGAYQTANQRVEDGGEYVETDAGGSSTPDDPPNATPPNLPQDPPDEDDADEDDRRGELGSGIETDFALDTARPDSGTDQVIITELVRGGEVHSIDGFEPLIETGTRDENTFVDIDGDKSENDEDERDHHPTNTSPDIDQPTATAQLIEDDSIVLSGFDISDPDDDILTATITAGSTLTLNPGSGVTILQGTGVDETVTVIQGTGEQITNALNGATYKPTADADVSGTLTVEVSDGQLSTTSVTVIPITPVQDAPVAVADVLTAGENDRNVTGNILANDFDVDTNPTPDELTVTSVTVDGETFDLTDGAVTVSVANGASITFSSDGSYVFNTNDAFDALKAGEVVTETISYTLSDGHEADHGQTVTGQLTVTITGENDAPVLTGDGQISVVEGHSYTLTQADLETVDLDDSPSSLVYTVTGGLAGGQLELSSAPGTAITTFTQQQLDDGEVVYVHNGSTETTDTFSFTVTDGLATVSGSVNVAVAHFNDDPSGSGLPISLTITEDTAASLDISSLSLSDPDAGNSPVKLILDAENASLSASSTDAVTVTSTATGLIIEGSTTDLIAALSDPSFITITPDADLTGTAAASVTVSINDNGNTGIGGGADIEIGEIAVNITSENDAPTLATLPEYTVTEDSTISLIFHESTVFDVDAGSGEVSLTFSIDSGLLTFPTGTGITVSGHTLTGTLADINQYLVNGGDGGERITYTPATDNTDPVTLTLTVDDQGNTGGSPLTATASTVINIDPVNDAPELIVREGTTDYTEDDPPTAISTTITIIDPDDDDLISEATVTISRNFEIGDILSFVDTANITGSYDATTGILTLTGDDTAENYKTALESITYSSTSQDPSELPRTISYQVADVDGEFSGLKIGATIEVTAVNDPATVKLTEDTTDFVEEDNPIVIDDSVSITDVDNTTLTGATVTITDNFEAGFDVLAFDDTSNISGSYDATTGVLTLTGTDTIAAYEAALSSITFENVSEDPNEADRTIAFKADDGSGLGTADTITVSVDGTNDAPEVTVSNSSQTYTEDDSPTVVDAGIEVDDVDSTDLEGATVSITSGFEADTDILEFTATGNISGSYDSSTGVLTLTGTDTVENYQSVLQSVTFSSSSEDPSETDRVINFQVTDGEDTSNSESVTVSVKAVNDAPEISLDSVAASADHVSNGGFEDGVYYAESPNILSSGSTTITDWIVTDDDVQYQKENDGEGESNRSVNLNGDQPGAISTTISTTVGQTYEVTFFGSDDGTLNVVATGGTTENYAFDSDAGGKYNNYVFTATTTSTTLTFTSTTVGDDGPSLDDVTVREVVGGGTINVVEDTPIEISDIQITDVDADADGDATFTVILSAGYGLLTVNDSVQGGVNDTNISDNGTYTVTLTGTMDEINETLAAVDGITYTPNLDYNGVDGLVVSVSDGGASGSGGEQFDTVLISLNVQAVDDSPPASSDVGDVVAGNVTNLTGYQFVGDDGDTVGNSVTNVGDINNDGIDDFAIGSSASSGESGTPNFSGSVYVIYGVEGSNPYASYANEDGEVNLDNVVADGGGFELVGAASGDQAGFSVSGGGDINNDGISDLVVGAYFADTPNLNAGTSYVVYGGQDFAGLADSTTGEISLGTVGVTGTSSDNLDGFKFEHTDSNSILGYDVSLTGDLNGDGISDLVVSSVGISTGVSGDTGISSSYIGTWVVFGGQDFSAATDASTGAFDVTDIGGGGSIEGFLLTGESVSDSAGLSVDVIGDVNGDGIDDLLVGAPNEESGASQGGASYVIYGGQDWDSLKSDTFPGEVSLDQLGTSTDALKGFKIQSELAGENLGITVSDAGDVNGDGTADLLVTSLGTSSPGVTSAAYLIYGGQNLTGTVSASLIGDGGTGSVDGYVFTEAASGETITHATALGDIDGDGHSDILVGVKTADDGTDMNVGKSYVIYGSSVASSGSSSVSDVVASGGGFEITGENAGDLFGAQAQSVGDVNDDGYNDFVVTAIGNDDGGTGAGAAYLIYGGDFENEVDRVAGADTEMGTSGNDVIHGTTGDDVIVGGGGNDVIITGAGDDTITINDDTVAYVDGGSGIDTLIFDDAGSFDLTNIGDKRLQSIEALDTTNGEVNDVTLDITDIFQISDDANTELETLLGDVLPTSFIINADDDDTYEFKNSSNAGNWSKNDALSASTADYDVYEYVEGGSGDVLATLAIDDDVSVTLPSS